MSMRARKYKNAMQLLYSGRAMEAMVIGKELLNQSDVSHQLSGHLCVGLVYEEGGSGVPQDLNAAILHYHKAAVIAQEPLTFCYLARATMKKGDDYYSKAFTFLQEASKLGDPVEILLGYAHYYSTKKDPNPRTAKKYYLRAALRGRFAGFFGYSSLCRNLGQNGRALGMDVLRLFLGPMLAVLLGSSAQDEF